MEVPGEERLWRKNIQKNNGWKLSKSDEKLYIQEALQLDKVELFSKIEAEIASPQVVVVLSPTTLAKSSGPLYYLIPSHPTSDTRASPDATTLKVHLKSHHSSPSPSPVSVFNAVTS